jgi:hypothetical protein
VTSPEVSTPDGPRVITSTSVPEPVAQSLPERPKLRWWFEILAVATFYGIYTTVRNNFGSAKVSPEHAYNNADRVIRFEKALGLFHEQRVQSWFADWHWFLRFWNIFYGSFHFVVTSAALIWCYRHLPHRLLDAGGDYGGAAFHAHPYGFIDTLAHVGGLWSFDSGTMQAISNQYAAMPSLHIAWSSWCVFVMWHWMPRPWQKLALIAYPTITLFCIVVTANHYWLDGVGGLVTLSAGYGVARLIEAVRWRRMERRYLARSVGT